MTEHDDIPLKLKLLLETTSTIRELYNYKEFYTEVELFFLVNGKNIEKKIENSLQSVPAEHREDVEDYYHFELIQNRSEFPAIHRVSLFITLYNFLEHRLNRLCRTIEEGINSRIRLKHLHGSGVERALLFLKKIPEFDFSEINNLVSFVKNTNRLRNIVVHQGGRLPASENEKIIKFVANQPLLNGSPGEKFFFDEQFVPLYIENLEALFKHIEGEIQRLI